MCIRDRLGEGLLLFLVGFLPQEQNLLANAIVSFACAMQVQAFRKAVSYTHLDVYKRQRVHPGLPARQVLGERRPGSRGGQHQHGLPQPVFAL